MKRVIDISELIYKSIIADENEKICCRQNYELINIIKNSEPYEERPTGEWVETDNFIEIADFTVLCPVCKIESLSTHDNFCPFCGADMRNNKKETT